MPTEYCDAGDVLYCSKNVYEKLSIFASSIFLVKSMEECLDDLFALRFEYPNLEGGTTLLGSFYSLYLWSQPLKLGERTWPFGQR